VKFWELWDNFWRQLDQSSQIAVMIIVVWVLLGVFILTIDTLQDASAVLDLIS
jgi:flagellar biosynthesis/type III secretory pathway M-ring protein FliF/YscJ